MFWAPAIQNVSWQLHLKVIDDQTYASSLVEGVLEIADGEISPIILTLLGLVIGCKLKLFEKYSKERLIFLFSKCILYA